MVDYASLCPCKASAVNQMEGRSLSTVEPITAQTTEMSSRGLEGRSLSTAEPTTDQTTETSSRELAPTTSTQAPEQITAAQTVTNETVAPTIRTKVTSLPLALNSITTPVPPSSREMAPENTTASTLGQASTAHTLANSTHATKVDGRTTLTVAPTRPHYPSTSVPNDKPTIVNSTTPTMGTSSTELTPETKTSTQAQIFSQTFTQRQLTIKSEAGIDETTPLSSRPDQPKAPRTTKVSSPVSADEDSSPSRPTTCSLVAGLTCTTVTLVGMVLTFFTGALCQKLKTKWLRKRRRAERLTNRQRIMNVCGKYVTRV